MSVRRALTLSLALSAALVTGCGAANSAPRRASVTRRPTAHWAHYVSLGRPARRLTPTAHPSSVRVPHIVWDPIPFRPLRKAQTVAYVRRHYHSFRTPTWHLIHPHVIVIHYTDASYGSTFNTFANDVPDSELHELPATSAHFVIDANGTIHQLVSLGTIARHTVGLNWTAIGVEHVGFSDAQVLDNRRQMNSSLHLVHWLQCRFHISIANVIGHAESLSSPYHHEDIPSLRTQTHSDFLHPDAQIYRRRLRALGRC
jgi:N-acetylmuramoyl-L-alanine amidase